MPVADAERGDMTQVRADEISEHLVARRRRRLLALAMLLGVALLAVLLQTAHAAAPAAGEEAPDFVLKSTAGANLRLSEYRSEVVALAFGASWCGVCRDGSATLASLQQEFAARGLRVLAVSFDADAASAPFPVLIDTAGETGRLYDVDDLPLVVLVDREGRLRHRFPSGRAVPEAALRSELGRLLAE